MSKITKIEYIFGISFVIWIISMGFIYHAHFIKRVDDELGIISSEIKFTGEEREYYNIYKDGQKVGYRSEGWLRPVNAIIFNEDTVIKLNLAGLSREVRFSSVVVLDSTSYQTREMGFSILSGSHSYNFKGSVRGDSLNIKVKKNTLAPERTGTFIIDESVAYSTTLPFYMHRSETETMSFMAFDPVIFSSYMVNCVRRGKENLTLENERINLQRYDLIFEDEHSSLWLDSDGRLVKAENYMFFSGDLGNLTIERASGTNVFQLPIEVSLGNDILKELAIYPDKQIHDPRNVEYLKIELDGIRAANIDVMASNKENLSFNPIIFEIHNKPVVTGLRKKFGIEIARIDTSLVGSSDYIQPRDARIIRTARSIVDLQVLKKNLSAVEDTLAMARAINRWVYENVEKMSGLDLVRSVDILRERKGDCDEHTKLFTALTRSIGIKTQINTGLVYDDGRFRYHSWPSVFVDDVWYDLDPVFGQDTADATHITLVSGDFDRLVELLRVVRRISIKILDYR